MIMKDKISDSDSEKYVLDKTNEIKQGHANVSKFVISVITVMTILCITYLIINI